jgi:hypothetical protein
MTLCWFARARADGVVVSKVELTRIAEIIAPIAGVTEALLFTPGATDDPYLNDGPPPALAMQIYFDGVTALEAALAADSALMRLTDRSVLPSLARADFTQQAMLPRSFATPDPVFRTAAGALACTYLVAYEGIAADLPAWLAHYIAHHAAIMTRFPFVRRVEVCTRIDWCGGLPWKRVDHMQRNKIAFDDAKALTAALNSPVRHEMRVDFARFPPFTGPVSHYPMTTRAIALNGRR